MTFFEDGSAIIYLLWFKVCIPAFDSVGDVIRVTIGG